jgi:hypothetical protein
VGVGAARAVATSAEKRYAGSWMLFVFEKVRLWSKKPNACPTRARPVPHPRLALRRMSDVGEDATALWLSG